MKRRENTRPVYLSKLQVGGQNEVIIQSMSNIKTEFVSEVASQIDRCALLGAKAMRLAIKDELDALAIPKIKELVDIPLIGDIHFDYKLALLAMENGIDGIRLNPGNIGAEANVVKVVDMAKAKKSRLELELILVPSIKVLMMALARLKQVI